MKRLVFFVLLLLLASIYQVAAQSDDIPTCPNENGVFYQANLFPRFEAYNQRLVLVDWSTGAEVRELATGLTGYTNYYLQNWSPECQYLVMGFAKQGEDGTELWDSYVWDLLSGQQIASFSDARLSPYPISWDTNSSRLMVETRFGAYLWYFDGSEVWVTSEADYNARSFRAGTLRWDYGANQVSGILSLPPYGTAVYDMATGDLLSLSDQFGRAIDPANGRYTDAQGSDGERYPCRNAGYYGETLDNTRLIYDVNSQQLVIQDAGTHEAVYVLEQYSEPANVGRNPWRAKYYVNCRFLLFEGTLYDLQNNQKYQINRPVHQFDIDPTGTYVVSTDSRGAYLYHLPSGRITTLVPTVQQSLLGSGRIWAYDVLEWDVANQQVRLAWAYSTETSVFDLNTGALASIVNEDNEAIDVEEVTATETRRNAPYGCRWSVEYVSYNQEVIIHLNHQRLAVLQSNFITEDFRNTGKSPDCRYVAAGVWNGSNYDTYVWDLNALNQPLIFADAHDTTHKINFAPYGGYAIIHTRNGGYLWHLPTDSRVQLNTGVINNNQSSYSLPVVSNFIRFQWDMSAGQLLAVPVERTDTVVAYDLATGAIVGEYHIAGRAAPVEFKQLDATHLLVTTSYEAREREHRANGFAIWNRQTGQGIQFAMDFYSVGGVQFSPDGSLLITLSANYVYVWDLNALSGSEPHLPNYVHQLASTGWLHFIDNNTIESRTNTSSREDIARRRTEWTYYQYDVRTGALLSEWQDLEYWYRDR
jgi:WD40 repeat protein